ncbi:hypothetical protein D5018_15975 [Parashewanella curva]|uniref:Uncharacterized protein n=1 Tax=Parashewanella curva TaxID=2338552 RepID=A0A3L8PVR4_9GAMM|nr:hypothetical protein [Parashewanella curva]RLV58673.1 hypothetical protein D5018_15975 [Parashewanella curva]
MAPPRVSNQLPPYALSSTHQSQLLDNANMMKFLRDNPAVLSRILSKNVTDWFTLGSYLGIDRSVLRNIEVTYQIQGIDKQMLEMVTKFLELPQPTLQKVIRALNQCNQYTLSLQLSQLVQNEFEAHQTLFSSEAPMQPHSTNVEMQQLMQGQIDEKINGLETENRELKEQLQQAQRDYKTLQNHASALQRQQDSLLQRDEISDQEIEELTAQLAQEKREKQQLQTQLKNTIAQLRRAESFIQHSDSEPVDDSMDCGSPASTQSLQPARTRTRTRTPYYKSQLDHGLNKVAAYTTYEILDVLNPVANKWHEIGSAFGIPKADLDGYQKTHPFDAPSRLACEVAGRMVGGFITKTLSDLEQALNKHAIDQGDKYHEAMEILIKLAKSPRATKY